VKCQTLWRPVGSAITGVSLHRRANALLIVVEVRSFAAGLGTGWGVGVAQFELGVGDVKKKPINNGLVLRASVTNVTA